MNHEDTKDTKTGRRANFSSLSFVLFVSSWFNSLCFRSPYLRHGDGDAAGLEDAADEPENRDGDERAVRLADHLAGDEIE